MTDNVNRPTREQDSAAQAYPNVAVQAVAGSGKTLVIIERVCYLLSHGGRYTNIVVITFTRRAAAEIQQRLLKRAVKIGFVGTVHSYLLHLINSVGNYPVQYAAAPQALFEQRLGKTLIEAGQTVSVRALLEHQDDQKYALATRVLQKVRDELERQGLIDFDQILRTAKTPTFVASIDHLKDTHLVIDEFQDTGPEERAFYEQITPKSMMIVGDPNQTLYSFRGADPDSMSRLAVQKNMVQLSLTRNFRCSGDIQLLSVSARTDGFLYREAVRRPWSIGEIASEIYEDPPDVVLVGTNRTVELLTDSLTEIGLLVTGRSKVTDEQRQLEAYIRWRANPENDLLLRHVLDLVDTEACREAKAAATRELMELADIVVHGFLPFEPLDASLAQLRHQYPDMTLSECAELVAEPMAANSAASSGALPIITCHASKGSEFDSVAWIDDLATNDHHRRMRYVACTRARSQLKIYRLAGRGTTV